MTVLLKILLKFFLKVPKIIFVTVATIFIAPFAWALFWVFISVPIDMFCWLLGWQTPGLVLSTIIAWGTLVFAIIAAVRLILDWIESLDDERGKGATESCPGRAQEASGERLMKGSRGGIPCGRSGRGVTLPWDWQRGERVQQ